MRTVDLGYKIPVNHNDRAGIADDVGNRLDVNERKATKEPD